MLLLQSDIDRLQEWCDKNHMSLNAKKCTHIKFTRKHNIINSTYHIGDEQLGEVDVIRDLGVLLDKKLTYQPQIETVIKRTSRLLGFIIRNSRFFRRVKTKLILYNSLVRSHLDYCCSVWRPHYSAHSLRIERIQKRFARHLAFIDGCSKHKYSYSGTLKKFRITTLKHRMDLLDLVFLYKTLSSGVNCSELLSRIRFAVPSRYPRHYIKPLSAPGRKSVLGQNSPLSRMSKLYNECSESVDIFGLSLANFRKRLEVEFYKRL